MKKLARSAVRAIWITIGLTALGLGMLGVLLPLLPTTPFVLLAAFAFAQSSERLHQWLLDHRVFGPMIDNWRRYGAIGRRAKRVSLASLAAVVALSIALGASKLVIGVQTVVVCLSGLFIATRPLPPNERS